MSDRVETAAEREPRRESSILYEKLLRGEVPAKEYVDALKREAREKVREFRKGRSRG